LISQGPTVIVLLINVNLLHFTTSLTPKINSLLQPDHTGKSHRVVETHDFK